MEHQWITYLNRNDSLQYDGWFIPKWTERGGKNKKLIEDMKLSMEESQFFKFKEADMDYNSIIPKSKSALKYPLYVIIEKLDEFLTEKYGKKTGFEGELPTKEHMKYYIIHVDPEDKLRIFSSFKNYKS